MCWRDHRSKPGSGHRVLGALAGPRQLRLSRLPGALVPVPLLVLLLVLLGLPAPSGAQSRSIRFEHLGSGQGLSQPTVNCILQDHLGFLWIGTQDGLNRYDGYGFRVYKNDPADPGSLPANWIETLLEDPSGDLWIGTQGAGLARWRRATDTFTHYRHDPDDPASLPGNRVRVLRFDHAGDLWVGTFQSGLARLESAASGVETGDFERFRHDPDDAGSLADDRVRAIHEDRSGNLWIGTLSGLEQFDDATRSFSHLRHDPADPESLSDDRVTALLEDQSAALWVGTENGLNRRDLGTSRFVRYLHDPADPASLSHDLVRALWEDSAERLWVGTDGGLNLLDRRGERFSRYLHDTTDPTSLSHDRVLAIFQDRGDVLWFGTQSGGVNKWNPMAWSFSHYRADSTNDAGLTHNSVFAFSEDRAGRLWIGTFGGGLDVLDRATGSWAHFRHDPTDPTSLADNQVTALLHDRDGVLWVGTAASGIDRFEPAVGRNATGAFRHFQHDPERPGTLTNDAISALFEDRAGFLWAATFRGGLNRFDAVTETFTSFRHDPARPESLSEDSLTALAEDADGFLWIGTIGRGLNRFGPAATPGGSGGRSAAETVRRIAHDPGLPAGLSNNTSLSNNTVYALHVDAAGILWVGTHVGLNKLEELGEAAIFRRYFERDGMASDLVYGIRPGADGHLWLATNNGLSRFDPETETFKNYDESHGLQGNEFNFGAHFASAGGELFFGGVNGFNAFHPDRIESNTAVPPVVLASFTKLNEPVSFGQPLSEVEEIALSYRDDLLTFEFAALDYTAPEENRYRYQLEGLNDAWIDLGTHRRMTFTDLAPGSYHLRVKGSNNDGVWNEEGTSIRLTIRPPYWQTWWFRLAGFLAAAGALSLVHHRRVEHAKRRQQELTELEKAAERERLIVQLESKNKELERFTYTVSHDLKAPLVTIRGFLGFLRQDAAAGQSERLERDIELIDGAAQKMSVLLEDLLALSRIGHQVNPPEEVPLGKLVGEAVKLVTGEIDERGVEVRVAPDLPVVEVDRARLVEVLQNLIQNAVKYMGDEESPRVEIGARREGPRHVFFVRDNGMGIEPQHHEKVFELFQRLDVEVEGTGIGLALAKRVVELHGGRIWVASEGPGLGSTFYFTLGEDRERRLAAA